MAELHEFRLPDIGDFDQVDIVEILVSPGDRVEKEQGLVVLESDKATMEVPSPVAGVVKSLEVSVGDSISEGDLIAVLEPQGEGAEASGGEAKEDEDDAEAAGGDGDERAASARTGGGTAGKEADGGEAGPSEKERRAGRERKPSGGERSERAEAAESEKAKRGAPARERGTAPRADEEAPALGTPNALAEASELDEEEPAPEGPRPPRAHASPSVRRLARELGVDLTLVPGTGRKGRIRKEDVQGFVKATLSRGSAAGVPIAGVSVAAPVEIDFSKFGETELQPLHRIRRISSANLHRSWVTVPHVTQHDEADITELDAFRRDRKQEAEARGVKLTFLPFLIQAVVKTLREFPQFNASLDPTGESLVVKRYYHIGVAVETEGGLVVPVVRDADGKGLFDLAAELADLSDRARNRRLRPGDLQGGSFSISSLGGIGGTFFTPIVNHPEVAILGVSRMEWKPVWRQDDAGGGEFVPRLVLPLSLSYDHRVVDGADAARFTGRLAGFLGDLRRLLL